MKTHVLIISASVAGLLPAVAPAQDTADGGWHYLVQAYAMFPNMQGETGIADLPPVQIDENPGDIFDNLQMGAMFFAEARNDHWAFSSDLLYMDLGADVKPAGIVTKGSSDVSQLGWELAAMRRVAPWFELGIGMTYNNLDASVKITTQTLLGTTDREAGHTEDWIDPTIVMRATFPLNDKWSAQARGNVGGFGVGSDLMWQLQADVTYRASARWSFAAGYRVIDIDYDQGKNAGRFLYDVRTFGPVLKLGYSF